MPARARKRAGPDPVDAFIQLAADPAAFAARKAELDDATEKATAAEAEARTALAALTDRTAVLDARETDLDGRYAALAKRWRAQLLHGKEPG